MIRMWNYRGLVSIQRLAKGDIRASAGVALSGEENTSPDACYRLIDRKIRSFRIMIIIFILIIVPFNNIERGNYQPFLLDNQIKIDYP